MDMSSNRFRLVLTEEADSFIKSLPPAASKKIDFIIKRVQLGERNAELFKKLDGSEIWEFRALFNRIKYRLFAFWDKESNSLVVATHGIVKKTDKTPIKEITKAEELKKKYFDNKNKKL